MTSEPLVSVIIPTYGRPHLVGRAIRSALSQSLAEIEVIVVVDGPDPATLQALAAIADPRLRVCAQPVNRGNGASLNAGIETAHADWVAILDDDDEWLPDKLALQLATARRSVHRYPVIATPYINRRPDAEVVWPQRLPNPGEPLCDYLFRQRGFRGGEGVAAPSTLLFRAALGRQLPFRTDLKRHVDSDWLLRAARTEGFALEYLADLRPMAICHVGHGARRMSDSNDWRYSLAWVREHRPLMTPEAVAGFLLTLTSQTASRAGAWRAFPIILWAACREGRPDTHLLVVHFALWFMPERLRWHMLEWRDRLAGIGRSGGMVSQ